MLFFSEIGFGQHVERFGFKVGVCSASQPMVSTTNGKADDQIESRLGLDAGCFVEWFFHPWFSLATEVHYIQKGMQESIPLTTTASPNGTGEYWTTIVRSNYLSIMVMPRARYAIGKIQLVAFAGPRLDLSLNNTVTVEGNQPTAGYIATVMQKSVDNYNKTQLGVSIGIGVQTDSLFGVTSGLEFRYSPNIQNAASNDVFTIRNTSFEVLLMIGM
jgi:hypothetical protein